MSDWKPFYIDTNVAFGLVNSQKNWEQMLAETASLPNVRTIENAWRHLTKTCLRPGSDPPSFGFYPGNTGVTLQKWMQEVSNDNESRNPGGDGGGEAMNESQAYVFGIDEDGYADYDRLIGPNFDCFLGEPEDRSWIRDGKDAMDRLNELHNLCETLFQLVENAPIEIAEKLAKLGVRR